MKSRMTKLISLAAVVAVGVAAVALATVTFDTETGEGFVGKGDVQIAFGWNNSQLQKNAAGVSFSYNSSTEATWQCVKLVATGKDGENINEILLEKSTTTTTKGLISSVARENSKGKEGPVTGFILQGWNGNVQTQHQGPAQGSCPDEHSSFVEGSLEVTPISGGLYATYGGNSVLIG